MVDIVTIEYCRGCQVRHPELAHPQTRYQELYRQVEQLLKQEGYRVFADRWPRTGSFEVSLNRKVVFSKLEGQVLPEPGQIVTIVLEAKRKTNLRMKALHKEQKVRDHNRSYWSPFINENYPHQRDYREVRASSVRKLWSTQQGFFKKYMNTAGSWSKQSRLIEGDSTEKRWNSLPKRRSEYDERTENPQKITLIKVDQNHSYVSSQPNTSFGA